MPFRRRRRVSRGGGRRTPTKWARVCLDFDGSDTFEAWKAADPCGAIDAAIVLVDPLSMVPQPTFGTLDERMTVRRIRLAMDCHTEQDASPTAQAKYHITSVVLVIDRSTGSLGEISDSVADILTEGKDVLDIWRQTRTIVVGGLSNEESSGGGDDFVRDIRVSRKLTMAEQIIWLFGVVIDPGQVVTPSTTNCSVTMGGVASVLYQETKR